MYAKYVYNAGANNLQVLSDLILLATGTTDVNLLSASCSKASTTIISTIPAGWTLHDNAASSTSKVIKAPYVDNASSYKYVQILVDSATSLSVKGCEDWNATSHTGTNVVSNYGQFFSATAGGVIYLFATARFFMIVGSYGTYYGDVSYNGPHIIAEYTRMQPWHTLASGYPAFAFIEHGHSMNYANQVKLPRVLDKTGTVQVVAYVDILTIGVGVGNWRTAELPYGANAKILNELGQPVSAAFPIYIGRPDSYVSPLGEISTICDIWAGARLLYSDLEEVTIAGNIYLAVKSYTECSVLVRKA